MSLFGMDGTMRMLNLLEKGMDVGMMRSEVLSNNIANVSVPHFKRSEVSFEADVKRAIESNRFADEEIAQLKVNQDRHLNISSLRRRSVDSVRPRVHIDYLSQMRNDGNNVDLEDESMKIVRNQMQYSFLANRAGDTFKQLNQLVRLA